MSGPRILPCKSIATWTPGCHPTLLVGGPAAGILPGRGSKAEAAARWLFPTAGSGLCSPLYFNSRGMGLQQVTNFTDLFTAWNF